MSHYVTNPGYLNNQDSLLSINVSYTKPSKTDSLTTAPNLLLLVISYARGALGN